MSYSPDGWIEAGDPQGPGVLQCKAVNAYQRDDWEDEPPLSYQVQLQHEMAVEGAQWGVLAALIGGQRFRWFRVERHATFVARLILCEQRFMRGVLAKERPPIDGSAACAELLRTLHPADQGTVVNLPDEAVEWDAQRQAACAEIKRLEAIRAEAENNIKAAIGDAEVGMLPGLVSYSWKATTYTYKATSAREEVRRVLRRREAK